MKRIVFGLDRLPRLHPEMLAHLHSIPCSSEPLRLNTMPISSPFFPAGGGLDHEARVNWARKWLVSFCGDYNPVASEFIDAYLDRASAHVADRAIEFQRVLGRFEGLYRPQDCLWSVLRPLARAWLISGETILARADVGFWDGQRFHGLVREGAPAEEADFVLLPLTLATTRQMADRLLMLSTMNSFLSQGPGGDIPVSPFRRAIAAPHFTVNAALPAAGGNA